MKTIKTYESFLNEESEEERRLHELESDEEIEREENRKLEQRIQHEEMAKEFAENSGGLNMDELEEVYYPPSESYELYDSETNTFYNNRGVRLRDPSEYNQRSAGYTPFGDE